MSQFNVYRNANSKSHRVFPLLLDVQSELLDELETRVVVPMSGAAAGRARLIRTLTPIFDIDGKPYAMLTPELAGVRRRALGAWVADLSGKRQEIVAALDLMITGI
jgi:toxin CcdB